MSRRPIASHSKEQRKWIFYEANLVKKRLAFAKKIHFYKSILEIAQTDWHFVLLLLKNYMHPKLLDFGLEKLILFMKSILLIRISV